MRIVKCIFSDQVLFMVHIPFNCPGDLFYEQNFLNLKSLGIKLQSEQNFWHRKILPYFDVRPASFYWTKIDNFKTRASRITYTLSKLLQAL